MNRSEKIRAFYPVSSVLSRRIVALKSQNLRSWTADDRSRQMLNAFLAEVYAELKKEVETGEL